MEIGMKGWLAVLLGGMGAISLTWLPPESRPHVRTEAVAPEQARFRALSAEVRVLRGILLRRHENDTLSRQVVAGGGAGLVVDGPAEIPVAERPDPAPFLSGEARLLIREGLERELARDAPEARAALGLFLRPRAGSGGVEASPFAFDTHMGVRDGVPYCFRVLRVHHPVRASRRGLPMGVTYGAALGACRVVARHGLPGEGVLAWLERGGIAFAALPAGDPRRPPFEAGMRPWAALGPSATLDPERCLAGIPEGCTAAFLDPAPDDEASREARRIVASAPVVGTARLAFRSVFGRADDYLLADLEAAFGPERFAAFWTSAADVPEAFEAAFGLPVGDWLAGWVAGQMERPRRPGPALPPSAVRATLLALLFGGVVSAGWAVRRRVA